MTGEVKELISFSLSMSWCMVGRWILYIINVIYVEYSCTVINNGWNTSRLNTLTFSGIMPKHQTVIYLHTTSILGNQMRLVQLDFTKLHRIIDEPNRVVLVFT